MKNEQLKKFAEFTIDKNKQDEKLKTTTLTGGRPKWPLPPGLPGNGGRSNGKDLKAKA